MRILFDQGTPVPLRNSLTDHDVKTAYEMSWDKLKNGELLEKASADFDLMITTDKNLSHQQNLSERKIAILVLPTTSWPKIKDHIVSVTDAVVQIQTNDFKELTW